MKFLAELRSNRKLQTGVICIAALILLALSSQNTATRIETSGLIADSTGEVQWKPPSSEKFAGSRVCLKCHTAECSDWSRHPMSQSAQTVSEYAHSVKRGPAESAAFATTEHITYRIEIHDQEMIHHEIMTDLEGQQIYCQSEPVHYVIGSGQQGHAFLIHRPEMLFVSPVNWYAGTDSWGLAPGYNPNSHNRFERRVTDACINCHTGRIHEDHAATDRFVEPFFHEMSIGCERCHGAAADHVSFHSGLGQTDRIVNPSKLSPARRDAVCNQCHLQGVERILRVGRSEFDFQPGMLLNDVWSVFVRSNAPSAGTPSAVSHTEQMQASRCYQESKGLMGCTSCHDVHSPDSKNPPASVYRDKCLRCHSNEACRETEVRRTILQDACTECHMPSGSASDVPHAIHTSHLIARRPETFFFPLTDSDTGKIALFREAGAVDLSSSEAARARGIALARLLDRGEQPESSATVEKLLREARIAYPDDSAICEALGLVLEKQERTFEASVIWKTGLKSDPTNESILFRLGRLCHDSGDLDTAADVLQAFIERNPWHAAVYGRYAHVLGLQGRLSEAIASAERAIQLDPSLIQVRGWLIEAYRVTGQDALAREQQEIYHRMLPITGLPDETGQPK